MGASNLARLGYSPKLKLGDGSDGWADQAPFDRVFLTATSPRIPPGLLDQLKVGGMALGPEREDPERGHGDGGSEVLVRYVRTAQGFERSVIYGVRFVPMTGKTRGRAPGA
jgi:protein-L-isoaspartate(D-aspartate) O-methyltransferase